MRKSMRILLTLVALLLTLAMCFAVTGCSDKDDKEKSDVSEKTNDKEIAVVSGLSSPEEVAEAFVESLFVDFDAAATVGLVHEADVDYMVENLEGGDTKEDLIEHFDKSYSERKSILDESFGDWSFTFEIEEVADSDSEDSVVATRIKNHYEEADIDIEDYKSVYVDGVMKYDDQTEDDVDVCVYVVQIDGKWYLDLTETLS